MDEDSLGQGSDVSQSDSLTVDMPSQASHPAPDQDIAHLLVDSVEDPSHCSEDMLPPGTGLPPDDIPNHLPVDNPPDCDSPDTDAPETFIMIPGSVSGSLLPQVVFAEPYRRVLRDRRSIKPPNRLVCEMNNQAIDDNSVSTVSVSSLVQFFTHAFSV